MFFLFLAFLLLPCGAVFAADQDQQLRDERRARVRAPLFQKPTRTQMDNALTEMETLVRQLPPIQQPVPVQQGAVQGAWTVARQQARTNDYYNH
jgi:hypothetical protein